jgi:hypothetical protein
MLATIPTDSKDMRVILIAFLLTSFLHGESQGNQDSIPTWSIHYGQKILFVGDINKLDKKRIVQIKIESEKLKNLVLRVIYKTPNKIKSFLDIDLYEIGTVTSEMEEVGIKNIHDIPLIDILDMAEMAEVKGDFRITLNYRDDKYFKVVTDLGTVVIMR